jgi:2-deoxy-scyllo-inosamine dehydrogenase (SAM-dependent)/8-amino-3,8-dideoxy-alpha-D-manno-octulosonate transaminase
MTVAPKNRISLFERLQIESQSNCNRSCWFCPRTYDRSGKYLDQAGKATLARMPTEKILDLLDQAQAMGFRGRVAFHYYSEPLLDERNIMLAREARNRGMRPYLHTNGDVVRHNVQLCQEISEIYEIIVVGLYDYRTNDELEESKCYWRKKLPGANLSFSPIGLSGARSAYSIGVPRALVPPDQRMSIPDIVFSNAPCHRPVIRMLIQYDGEMCHCCEDIHGSFQLGNVYRSSLKELWFSEHHQKIIVNLIEGARDKYQMCRACPMSPTAPAPTARKMGVSRRYEVAAL